MRFPFVSRALFDEVNAERKKLLDLILKHQLGDTLYAAAEPALEIDPEKLAAAKEEVQEQARATLFSMMRRRPSLIASEMSRRKEAEYQKKFQPNNFVASLEEIERGPQKTAQA